MRGFDRYFVEFDHVTRRAHDHFATCSWEAARRDIDRRLDLYRSVLDDTLAAVMTPLGAAGTERATWVQLHDAYDVLLSDCTNRRLGETWFNSMTRRVWDTVGVDPEIEFIASDRRPGSTELQPVVVEGPDLAGLVAQSIRELAPNVPWVDFNRDLRRCVSRIMATTGRGGPARIEMAPEPFFRGHGCYLVGRIAWPERAVPLIYSIRNPDGRLVLDAVITDEDRASILFSFTRSYFHVRTEHPDALVAFLALLMPRKRVAELYNSIGFDKHGKTELYRDLLEHLETTDQCFRIAPGQPGLVMTVFGMPDYEIVFKVIKDTFPPPKRTTRGQIREKYRLVYRHDRAGRLVEAQEFEHLSLSQDRFAPELLDHLAEDAARTVRVEGRRVIIDHAYIERKVTPLDLYIRDRDARAAIAAIIDYGDAIRDLMASDIFPGDMLLKNFGVTRHGRVVFYDYDELTRMRDCSFRKIPEAPSIEDEMAAVPWFSVADSDVFPEEFPRFMGLPPDVRAAFNRVHADLFDHRTWLECQRRILDGEVIEIFPYPPSYRLGP